MVNELTRFYEHVLLDGQDSPFAVERYFRDRRRDASKGSIVDGRSLSIAATKAAGTRK